MKTHNFYSFLFLISIAISASAFSIDLLGIAPEDEKYYKADVIKCKDGSKKFKREQLNDEFCDCPDGTDEPGTSACPEGKFYCRNAGHSPLILYSSRVNDGICDCCDGSDEYDGKAKCPNTCWEAGKVAREKLKKKIATYQEGVTLRKKEVEQAKQAFSKDEADLLKLKNEEKILKGLVQQLKEQKEQIEKAEEQERLKKEKEKKLREAEENASEQEKKPIEKHETEEHIDEVPHPKEENADAAVEAGSGDNSQSGTSPSNVIKQETAEGSDGTVVKDESKASVDHAAKQEGAEANAGTVIKDERGHDAGTGTEAFADHAAKQEQEKSDTIEGLSKEELGRLVASRWTGENAGQQTKELDNAKEEEDDGSSEIPEAAENDGYDGYSSATDEDDRKYDNDEMEEHNMDDEHDDRDNSYNSDVEDYSDSKTLHSQSWLDKLQQTVRNILQAVSLFKTPVDISEAARVRKEYDESSQKLSKMQSRISSLSEKLKHDFGMEKEFYSFYDHCFESKQNKYVYKVCPFKQASQVEGHSTTQLGRWEKFEESYRIMQFSSGDKCWNGPDRSLKVRLRCGLKNELADVDEPSRCEYVAVLSTPALCLEERLKELHHKLDLMNTKEPKSHDEL
ncbi:hypothetical protein MRB53_009418 [Persea americana]|uniref:Uncharacterized protein n=1 Tax=Persea americana TaxID=3435 RepID=A0ACC2LQ41_PERAE|nr:hypothetical protein MRB53_009418 [Persea americana]|eukprot:TRINITY_DN3974_c0_g5_i1.p1 TRINITY_DN3974_c0_g5~~TRINITY_DN3974_c0_g5_i1.p1  ORF type:complete len:624 (+),score=189.74 TRINITY_DN3974_c0_g5_i1:134-2005(+)